MLPLKMDNLKLIDREEDVNFTIGCAFFNSFIFQCF